MTAKKNELDRKYIVEDCNGEYLEDFPNEKAALDYAKECVVAEDFTGDIRLYKLIKIVRRSTDVKIETVS